ncbi:MAG: hypothetical protein COA47_11125 [Robiginitomaculum sp.]|nr:MAG: hypothetical protein COA47_11125 [Robiginitomaculum sp.]
MIVGFAIGFLLLVVIFSFFPKSTEIPPVEISESFVLRTEVEDLIVLRDTLRPGSQEAYRQTYKTIVWAPEQHRSILEYFHKINKLAPGLLSRGASDGTIAVYLTDLPNYAKGGTQNIAIDEVMFAYPDFSHRVLFHEMVHAGDSYRRVSNSEAFRRIFEPRIRQAIALLKSEGLTPSTAAALPLGERRKQIEDKVRMETGLPSAYASRNLGECLAEVISFWLSPEYSYTPPLGTIELLFSFVEEPALPNLVDVRFRAAEAMLRADEFKKALRQFSRVIRDEPKFYQAYSMRGYLYLNMKKYELALQDLKQARDLVPRLEADYAFYDNEWKRVSQLIAEQE